MVISIYINQTTAEGIVSTQVKLISEAIGAEGGDIAILSATANATNQNAWIELMIQLTGLGFPSQLKESSRTAP